MNGYMGVDIGTSGCKAVVFDEDGCACGSAYREYGVICSEKGWVELDSDLVIAKCFEVIKEASIQSGAEKIIGLGISSQGEAFTPVDKDGKALCNAFVSSDMRADSYAVNLPAGLDSDMLYRITGHTPHPMFSLFKLLWLIDNRPDIIEKTDKFLCFEDLLQYRLGIEPAMGYPLAGRTMLFDVVNKCWSKEILDRIKLPKDKFSHPVPSGTVVGTVCSAMAKDLHLDGRTFVVAGGHDQVCAGMGAGAVKPGVAVYSMGTVDCVTPAFSKPVFSEQLKRFNLCTYNHTVKDTYATVAFSLTGGNIMKWFRDEFAQIESQQAAEQRRDVYDILLEQMPDKPTDLLVLPYFTPTGTPYFDTQVKGLIYGLDMSTKRGAIFRALLEGVAMEIKLNLEFLRQSGCVVNELRAIGGGAKSDVLLQLKADVLNMPIAVPDIKEAGCMGMAMLVKQAYRGIPAVQIADQWLRITGVKTPNPQFAEFYNKQFTKYKQLYPLMKQL